MTHRPPHPEPERTTGLEPGGGVPPGETPPAEGGMSGLSHREPTPSRAAGGITMVVIGVITALVLTFLLLHVAGIIEVL